MPQLRSVDLSTANPRSPDFLQVLVRRAEPAQTSMTKNSSKVTPENLLEGPCVLLQECWAEKSFNEFYTLPLGPGMS